MSEPLAELAGEGKTFDWLPCLSKRPYHDDLLLAWLLRLSRCKLVSAVNNVLNNIMSTVSNPITDAFVYCLSVRVILCNTSVRRWSLALARAELRRGVSSIV